MWVRTAATAQGSATGLRGHRVNVAHPPKVGFTTLWEEEQSSFFYQNSHVYVTKQEASFTLLFKKTQHFKQSSNLEPL